MNPRPPPGRPVLTFNVRDLFDLSDAGDGLFAAARGQSNFSGVVYGGQMLGQALAAATATAPDGQNGHAVHAHFLQSGDAGAPIRYEVFPLRVGGASSVLRVEARQADALIFHATCAFARERPQIDWRHQSAAPAVPPPQACADVADFVRANAERLPEDVVRRFGAPMPLQRRLADPEAFFFGGDETRLAVWLRLPDGAAMTGETIRRCAISYLSDAWVVRGALAGHRSVAAASGARLLSLDHAVWIHAAPALDDWLLYAVESPYAGDGRGLGLGRLYDRTGRLIATAAQEGLVVLPR